MEQSSNKKDTYRGIKKKGQNTLGLEYEQSRAERSIERSPRESLDGSPDLKPYHVKENLVKLQKQRETEERNRIKEQALNRIRGVKGQVELDYTLNDLDDAPPIQSS